MRQLLIVAYYFPPLGGIGSLRVHGHATHLPAYGWQPTILAPLEGAYFRDPGLSFPEADVIRTPSLELSRLGKRVMRAGGSDQVPAQVSGLRGAARTLAHTLLYFPDAQVGWYPPALMTSRRVLRDRSFDAVFSTSFPITAHLIARRLSRWMGIPWIAEFRDPWSQMLAEQRRPSARALRLETAIARESTACVMTSPSWARQHEQLWGCQIAVIPNGHDGAIAAARSEPRFTVSYLGSFYPETQSLTAFWDGIARLRDAADDNSVHVRFIGDLHPEIKSELDRRGLRSQVEDTGFLSHTEALAYLSNSSLVLVAGPRDARGLLRGQVAAKLAEYLATDLPILYVGDPDADAADLLRRFPGTHVVPADDADGVIRVLREEHGKRYERDCGALSRHALAGRLAELLDEACTSRRAGQVDG